MLRASAPLVVLATLAGISSACPWWGRRCPPAPAVIYPCPPPGIVYTVPPPAVPEPPAAASAPAEPLLDRAALYEKAVGSCVFIVAPTKTGHAEGSGALIDAEKRLVITSYDITSDAAEVGGSLFVQFPVRLKDGSLLTDKKKYLERIPAGQALKGTVLYRDKARGLALLKLDRLPPHTPALPLARKSVKVGETVIHIGSPGKANQTFAATEGQVRAVGMVESARTGSGDGARRPVLRQITVTNLSPTNAGGPVIDRRGYLVGMVEYAPTTQNVTAAVDVTEVLTFLKEKKVLINGGRGGPDPRPHAGPNADPPPDGVNTLEAERAAAQALQRAKLFAGDEASRETYVARLKAVVTRHPGTPAAKEAQKLLDGQK